MSVVSMCYWNSTISVVATGGADSPDYVVALAEYCRLLELKNNSCGIHSVGRQFEVTSNLLKYMGNGDSCEIVYVEDICADVDYVIYEKYLEPYGLSENDSLIRIVADEFLLGVIDTAQPEENRLGMEFIRANMSTHEEYDLEELPF